MKNVSVLTIVALLFTLVSVSCGLANVMTSNLNYFLGGVLAGMAAITVAILSFRE